MTQQPIQPVGSRGLSQSIVLTCVDPWGRAVDVPTTLGYRVEDPYAISLAFHSASDDVVEWVVSRALLVEGVTAPCGDGDVRVYPSIDEDARAVSILDFSSPDGRLVAQADSVTLQGFLGRTFELVPAGAESDHLDMDGLIAALLGAA